MPTLSIVKACYHHNDKENSDIEGFAQRIT